jgi:hypothetical protein
VHALASGKTEAASNRVRRWTDGFISFFLSFGERTGNGWNKAIVGAPSRAIQRPARVLRLGCIRCNAATIKHSLGRQVEPDTLRMERTLPAPVERT